MADEVHPLPLTSDPSRFEANLLSIEANPVRSEMDRQGFEVELPGIESFHPRPEMEWFRAHVDRETMLEWLVAWEELDASWREKDEPANLASPIDLEDPLRQKSCPLVECGESGTESAFSIPMKEDSIGSMMIPQPQSSRRLNALVLKLMQFIVLASMLAGATSAFAAPTFVRVAAKLSPNDPPQGGLEPLKGQGQFTVSGVTAGNFLVVITSLSVGDVALPTTVTSPGETWIRDLHSYTQGGITGDSLDIFHVANVSGGTKTLTITSPQTARSLRAVVLEYSGVAANSTAHKTSIAYGLNPSGGPPLTGSAGSVTTTISNCLIVVGCRTDSDFQGWSPGSGYTMRTDSNLELEPDQKLGVEDRIAAAPGTYSGTFTFNSDICACGMVAYAPAGGGSVGSPPLPPTGLRVVNP